MIGATWKTEITNQRQTGKYQYFDFWLIKTQQAIIVDGKKNLNHSIYSKTSLTWTSSGQGNDFELSGIMVKVYKKGSKWSEI